MPASSVPSSRCACWSVISFIFECHKQQEKSLECRLVEYLSTYFIKFILFFFAFCQCSCRCVGFSSFVISFRCLFSLLFFYLLIAVEEKRREKNSDTHTRALASLSMRKRIYTNMKLDILFVGFCLLFFFLYFCRFAFAYTFFLFCLFCFLCLMRIYQRNSEKKFENMSAVYKSDSLLRIA